MKCTSFWGMPNSFWGIPFTSIHKYSVPPGCKESHFYTLPFGQAVVPVACTSPQVISTSPKPFLISRIDYNPSVIWISLKNSACPSGKLRTKITSPRAKSTSPGLSDTTFFAHWPPSERCQTPFEGFHLQVYINTVYLLLVDAKLLLRGSIYKYT